MHPGQLRAWDSTRRFIVVLAGTQSGKTAWGPVWLWREIRNCGPGDYLAVTATYDLLKLKMLPSLLDWFVYKLGIGVYSPSDRVLSIPSLDARIILRSAESNGGLESATAKAAWLDEAGQDNYNIGTWEAVLRRLSIYQGRALITTTLYNLGWLKGTLYDPWAKGDKDIEVIQFDSTENPAFPKEEFERARDSMPAWRFNMFYRGQYERPAGQIYDCFVNAPPPEGHVIPAFTLPDEWPRYGGADFGGSNTAALLIAQEPSTGNNYVYWEYHAGGKTSKGHVDTILAHCLNSKGETIVPHFVGGAASEDQWRREWKIAGLPVAASGVTSVEVGINRAYSLIKSGKLFVFDTCRSFIDDLQSYARKLDERGEPTEEIQDKSTWHRIDAFRYIAARLAAGEAKGA